MVARLVRVLLRAVIYRTAGWYSDWQDYSRDYDKLAAEQRRARRAG